MPSVNATLSIVMAYTNPDGTKDVNDHTFTANLTSPWNISKPATQADEGYGATLDCEYDPTLLPDEDKCGFGWVIHTDMNSVDNIMWRGLKVEHAFQSDIIDHGHVGNVQIMVVRPVDDEEDVNTNFANYSPEEQLENAAELDMNSLATYHHIEQVTDKQIISFNGGINNACLLDAGEHHSAIAFKDGNDTIVMGVITGPDIGLKPIDVINRITVS